MSSETINASFESPNKELSKSAEGGTILSKATSTKTEKASLGLKMSGAFHGKNSSSFKSAFKQLVKSFLLRYITLS